MLTLAITTLLREKKVALKFAEDVAEF